jgi:hypothetical protein
MSRAIQTALAAGETVQIDGPVRGLEFSPEAVGYDAIAMITKLRRAQVEDDHQARLDDERRDDEHLAALRLEEERLPALPTAPPRPRARGGKLGTILFVFLPIAALTPPALLVRLLTWPLRRWLRERTEARRLRGRAKIEQSLAEATAKAEAAPENFQARIDRAVYLAALGHHERADRELSVCLRERDDLALAWHNLAVTRERLRLPRLAAAAAARAKELGHVAPPPRPDSLWKFLFDVFVAIAGLAPRG